MNTQGFSPQLTAKISEAVKLTEPQAVSNALKRVLTEAVNTQSLSLPSDVFQNCSDHYARRLLHHDPQLGYTIVAMTWGVGHKTPLHDHAGTWCVEVVVRGQVLIRQFELINKQDNLYQFREMQESSCGEGSAGVLIPPYEYHTVENALPNEVSTTLHIYAENIAECGCYQAVKNGWYERYVRTLSYDALA